MCSDLGDRATNLDRIKRAVEGFAPPGEPFSTGLRVLTIPPAEWVSVDFYCIPGLESAALQDRRTEADASFPTQHEFAAFLLCSQVEFLNRNQVVQVNAFVGSDLDRYLTAPSSETAL